MEEGRDWVVLRPRNSRAILVVAIAERRHHNNLGTSAAIAGEQAVPGARQVRAETAHLAVLAAAVMLGRPAIVGTRVLHQTVAAPEAAVAWEDRAVGAAAADWAEEVAQVAAEVAEEVEADE